MFAYPTALNDSKLHVIPKELRRANIPSTVVSDFDRLIHRIHLITCKGDVEAMPACSAPLGVIYCKYLEAHWIALEVPLDYLKDVALLRDVAVDHASSWSLTIGPPKI